MKNKSNKSKANLIKLINNKKYKIQITINYIKT